LIVNPHGGPFGVRDSWGFNSEHQFFANRGYAVLQVNFRGSGGYGREFEQAGYREWGRKMQNDVTDAVRWAIDQGIADPERICIYGGSYGGYATMAGLAFTPDLYQCGINYVGVTDVELLFETMPEHWSIAREVMEQQIGDPDDESMMRAISPLYHTDKIDDPVLILQGKRDPRVVMEHATRLRDKLEDSGKKYEWLMKNDEGHGFRKEENRIEAYTLMEDFLAKYL
jgi:dipeptidyl aminopeptidase/acylaminoacyl peptidase